MTSIIHLPDIARDMSRFWAGGSSSESENESGSESEEEMQTQKVVGGKFIFDSDSGKWIQ